mgnify:CR=1 FL=1
MSKYRLKMPVEKINFHSWRIIFNTLRGNNYYEYMIAENDEYFFDNEFNSDIMDVLAIVLKSPQYRVEDKYVLYDRNHSLLLSGDEKLILSVLSIHFRPALEIFIRELDNGHLGLDLGLEGVFEEYEA